MPWYRKPQFSSLRPREPQESPQRVPDGLWHRCPACLSIIYARDFTDNLKVCPSCGFHEKLSSEERLAMLVDDGTFDECDANVSSIDALGFVDSKPYPERLAAMKKRSGLVDAVRCGTSEIGGQRVSLAVMDFAFVGGSMGSVVGEKVTRAIERAIELRIPMLTVVTSGGARMQESTYSLMQMAKTSAALARLDDARLPHIVILTNPSTAGVMASYGSLGDVIIAEPDALIGFAGPRVIEQTIRQKLPRGFQRSEFVKEHGFVDIVCERAHLRDTVITLLGLLRGPHQAGICAELPTGEEEEPIPAEERVAPQGKKRATKVKATTKKPAKRGSTQTKSSKKRVGAPRASR
ncbi:acetyl-CoA carboxylase carboxyltransferase subunit beta [Candidatus Sumerlaeota bacterium]|nr:acetyl-CoA carboxylase carboxyltransferase subunit beta [Candidatus Sumerlaeota bacterium]